MGTPGFCKFKPTRDQAAASPGFGLLFLSSDSCRFRPCGVRIRVGFAGRGPNSDSDRPRRVGPGPDSGRFRRARFGFGSGSAPRHRVRFGFGRACRFDCYLATTIASGGHAPAITKPNAGCNYLELMSPLQCQLFIITLTPTPTEHARRKNAPSMHWSLSMPLCIRCARGCSPVAHMRR